MDWAGGVHANLSGFSPYNLGNWKSNHRFIGIPERSKPILYFRSLYSFVGYEASSDTLWLKTLVAQLLTPITYRLNATTVTQVDIL